MSGHTTITQVIRIVLSATLILQGKQYKMIKKGKINMAPSVYPVDL